jgi:RNA 2',3'-cyclic 3'-phosphodiesterase
MRLFIAIPLPQAATTYLAEVIRSLRKPDDGIKWVEPHNIHLTIRFLGETSENFVPVIRAEMLEVASSIDAFDCKLGEVEVFPNLHRPRVIWVGLDGGMDALMRAAAQMELRMRAIGFAHETKPFKPHLTLGRIREGAPPVVLQTDAIAKLTPPDLVSLDRLVLFHSTLTTQGPVYKALFTAEFS